MLPTDWLGLPLFLLLLLLQWGPGEGELQITLYDATGTPLPQTLLHFISEGGLPLASCGTDAAGRCTLSIEAAPTDAAGLIRGTLQVEGHGSRPLIWPGGPLTLVLQLDESGHLPVGHDVYATRLPAIRTLSPTPTSGDPTPKVPTGVPILPSPTAAEAAANQAISWGSCLVGLSVLGGLLVAIFFSIWTSAKGGGR